MKDNKKIIIVVVLIIVLVGTIYFVYGGEKESAVATATTVDKSGSEIKLEKILSSIEGVGTTEVMINESDGQILGVVIVCEGADNIMTRSNILNAVSTALNIDKKIIVIYAMNV